MKALIDADSLLYKAGFSYEEKTDWNSLEREIDINVKPSISITSNVVEAKNAIDGLIENIKFKTGCEEVELWLTGSGNFRYNILDTYKHNRKDSRKPIGYSELWDYLIDKYKANVAVGYEADDVVVYKKTTYPDDYYLCAIDKDVLKQTIGTHYNYGKDELETTTEDEAIKFFYYQILAGDPVDGYKGIPSIGKVKAWKLVDSVEDGNYWDMCIDTCMKIMDMTYEGAEEYMLQQARMAGMHQLKEDENGGYVVVLFDKK